MKKKKSELELTNESIAKAKKIMDGIEELEKSKRILLNS